MPPFSIFLGHFLVCFALSKSLNPPLRYEGIYGFVAIDTGAAKTRENLMSEASS